MDQILVLMSTYNGEKYLDEQLKSIFSQEDMNVSLMVRDDGSTDHTLDILNQWKTKSNLQWYQGENLRSARSFMDLCQKAVLSDSEYFAFSDQDDYWLPEKIKVAVDKLKESDGPSLYFSQTQLADENLSPIATQKLTINGTFAESLIHYFVGGCTMVFNRSLLQIINRYQPQYLLMHDVWIYSLALAIGAKVVFDPEPHIYYRQHSNNVIGQKKGIKTEWKRRLTRFFSNECSRSKLANELMRGYSDLIALENRELLEKIIHYKHLKNRISLQFDKRFLVGKPKTDFFFKLSVWMGQF